MGRAKKKRFQRVREDDRLRERFVFVDECSTNISLALIYARAPRGARAYGKGPIREGAEELGQERLTLICAIDSGGVKTSMSVEGAVDSKVFESYIEHFLTPTLERAHRSW
jgi:hypothetical protein